MKCKITFLGTSASLGVPVVGCKCDTCSSKLKQNKRLRSSLFLETENQKFLIDAGPDFRSQALSYQISNLNGVFLTHTHFDHVAGLDDLRVFAFFQKKPLPLLVSRETKKDLTDRFPYLFIPENQKFSFKILKEERGQETFEGLNFSYLSYGQANMKVTGLRFNEFAFITDIKEYENTLFEDLQGVKTLVISALNWEPTRAHLGIKEVLEIGEKLKVERLYLSHIGHELEYEKTNNALPNFAKVAYDGLSIEVKIG